MAGAKAPSVINVFEFRISLKCLLSTNRLVPVLQAKIHKVMQLLREN